MTSGVTTTSDTTTEPSATTPTDLDFLLGDVNEDGEVNVSDAQLALVEYVATMSGKTGSFTDRQVRAADVNGDGRVTVEDAQFILLYYVRNTLSKQTVTWEILLRKPVKEQ